MAGTRILASAGADRWYDLGRTVLLVDLFGGLIGLNAALFAFQWGGTSSTGTSQTTTGIAGIAAPQACCCCGPMLSQVAVVTLDPSAAAPIYLLFADPSSSIGSLFFVVSVTILTGTLIRAASRRDGFQCESEVDSRESGP